MSASEMPRTGAAAVAIVPRVPCDPIARHAHPAWRHVNPCATPAPFQGEVLQTVPKRETAVWRLAREADGAPRSLAGQVPRRWLSA